MEGQESQALGAKMISVRRVPAGDITPCSETGMGGYRYRRGRRRVGRSTQEGQEDQKKGGDDTPRQNLKTLNEPYAGWIIISAKEMQRGTKMACTYEVCMYACGLNAKSNALRVGENAQTSICWSLGTG